MFQYHFLARSVSLIYVLRSASRLPCLGARKKHVSSACFSPSLHLHCIVKTRIYISMNVSDVRVDIVVLSRRSEDSARGDRNRRYTPMSFKLGGHRRESCFPPLFYKREDFRREHAIGVHASTGEGPIIGASRKTRDTRDILFNAEIVYVGLSRTIQRKRLRIRPSQPVILIALTYASM